jgi:hypothetical protein
MIELIDPKSTSLPASAWRTMPVDQSISNLCGAATVAAGAGFTGLPCLN